MAVLDNAGSEIKLPIAGKHFYPCVKSSDFGKAIYENAKSQVDARTCPCPDPLHPCDLDHNECWDKLLRGMVAAVQ